jgi:hypothetical protein
VGDDRCCWCSVTVTKIARAFCGYQISSRIKTWAPVVEEADSQERDILAIESMTELAYIYIPAPIYYVGKYLRLRTVSPIRGLSIRISQNKLIHSCPNLLTHCGCPIMRLYISKEAKPLQQRHPTRCGVGSAVVLCLAFFNAHAATFSHLPI